MGGRMTVGKIIGEAFRMYKRHFKVFFITALIIYGFVYLIGQFSDFVITGVGMDITSIQDRLSYENLQNTFRSSESFLPLMPLMFIPLSFAMLFASFALRDLITIPSDMISINAKDSMLHICYGMKPGFRGIVRNFSRNWKRYLGVSAWSKLWISIWTLLFFVPGIIKTFSYMLAPYLIIEYPDLTIRQALKKSMEITNGYKGRLFGLGFLMGFPFGAISIILAFIFVFSNQRTTYEVIMAIATPVVMLFILEPVGYMMNTIAYMDIKLAAIEKGILPPSAKNNDL